MSDQGFREVQLSGKQVVFLFMALAVALVGTFLLGVSVGRHVEPDAAAAQATPTAPAVTDPNPNAPLPPATTVAPGGLDFQHVLGKGDAKADPKSPEPPGAAKPTATPVTPTATPTQTPTPTAKPADPGPAATGSWYVQVNSFNSSANAAKQVSDLKAKNITATTVKAGTHFQVRVGPSDRTTADAMKARLEKLGYKPRVTR